MKFSVTALARITDAGGDTGGTTRTGSTSGSCASTSESAPSVTAKENWAFAAVVIVQSEVFVVI